MLTNSKRRVHSDRKGAVLVLFVVMLPVLIILSAVAINLAKVELVRTELQIGTDLSTRAGGTVWTRTGQIAPAVYFAKVAGSLNEVQNTPLIIADSDIAFGNNLERANGGTGRFVFTERDPAANPDIITAIEVDRSVDAGLFFEISEINSITTNASSVTSQVDRDIALVVDRSGSMAYFENEQFLFNTLTSLYNRGNNEFEISAADFIDAVTDFQGPTQFDPENPDVIPQNLPTVNIEDTLDAAGSSRTDLPALSLNDRFYPDSVLTAIAAEINSSTDPVYTEGLRDLRIYAETLNRDYNSPNRTAAPEQSRWAVLEQAVDAFVIVLQNSRLREKVAVASFDRNTTLDQVLTQDLQLATDAIGELIPSGSTAIGLGIQTAATHLLSGRRINAIPTMIVLSDGRNRRGISPLTAARNIKNEFPFVVINTITFADGDQTEMAEVARIGGGIHRHANDGDELREHFEEIARSFSTVITE